jgi:large subunit GTPase 1
MQKKVPRTKGDRGQEKALGSADGLGLVTGRKGGLVRVGGY